MPTTLVATDVIPGSPATEPDDLELVVAVNQGDAAAFEVLYRRHRDWVVNLALRFTRDEALALDVLQETFLYLLRKFPGFELRARLTTFLYPVIRHLALAAHRKAARCQATEDGDALLASLPAPEPWAGGGPAVRQVIAGLSLDHQEVLFLRFVDGLSLGEIQRHLGSSRIFSFGIGSSVNRYLIEHMAKLGRGAVAYLGPNDSAARVMDDFIERIRHPALTDVQIDWGGLAVSDVFPRPLPDLFVGRPILVTGRWHGGSPTSVRLTGLAGGQRLSWNVPVSAADPGLPGRGLAGVWARQKIAALSDQAVLGDAGSLAAEIRQVALDYGLLSAFTAYLAVDSSRVTAGDEGTTVPVAVPVPEGVKYKTAVPQE